MAKKAGVFSKDEKEMLSSKIENEGFDYCFIDYSDWEEIKDPKFHELKKAYENSRAEFKKYLEDNGVETEL